MDIEHGGDNLSYIIPVGQALPMTVSHLHLPDLSWELRQIPMEKRGEVLSFAQLVKIGHIDFKPSL